MRAHVPLPVRRQSGTPGKSAPPPALLAASRRGEGERGRVFRSKFRLPFCEKEKKHPKNYLSPRTQRLYRLPPPPHFFWLGRWRPLQVSPPLPFPLPPPAKSPPRPPPALFDREGGRERPRGEGGTDRWESKGGIGPTRLIVWGWEGAGAKRASPSLCKTSGGKKNPPSPLKAKIGAGRGRDLFPPPPLEKKYLFEEKNQPSASID